LAPLRFGGAGLGSQKENTMPEPVRQKDRETFLARANQARADADAATLENVRERCLRAESAWREMAARVERTDLMRANKLAEKLAESE
jgi:hypothetical protein